MTTPDENLLSLNQVVERFETSRPTLMRWLKQGRFPSAVQDDSKRWLIHVHELSQSGLKPREINAKSSVHGVSILVSNGLNEHVQELTQKIAILENEIAAEKRVSQALEDRATSAERTARMLETMMQQLASKPSKQEFQVIEAEPVTADDLFSPIEQEAQVTPGVYSRWGHLKAAFKFWL